MDSIARERGLKDFDEILEAYGALHEGRPAAKVIRATKSQSHQEPEQSQSQDSQDSQEPPQQPQHQQCIIKEQNTSIYHNSNYHVTLKSQDGGFPKPYKLQSGKLSRFAADKYKTSRNTSRSSAKEQEYTSAYAPQATISTLDTINIKESSINDMMKLISEENTKLIQMMNPEEIQENLEDIYKRLPPDIIDMLKNRKFKTSAQACSSLQYIDRDTTEIRQEAISTHNIEQQTKANELAKQARKSIILESVNSQQQISSSLTLDRVLDSPKSEPEKMQWTTDAQSIVPDLHILERNVKRMQDEFLGTAASWRFDFSGNRLSESEMQEISVSHGLHNHGIEPEKAGYTLPELLILARSSFSGQRVIALRTITAILKNNSAPSKQASIGQFSQLWRAFTQAEGIEVVITALQNIPKDVGQRATLQNDWIKCMDIVLQSMGGEFIWNANYLLYADEKYRITTLTLPQDPTDAFIPVLDKLLNVLDSTFIDYELKIHVLNCMNRIFWSRQGLGSVNRKNFEDVLLGQLHQMIAQYIDLIQTNECTRNACEKIFFLKTTKSAMQVLQKISLQYNSIQNVKSSILKVNFLDSLSASFFIIDRSIQGNNTWEQELILHTEIASLLISIWTMHFKDGSYLVAFDKFVPALCELVCKVVATENSAADYLAAHTVFALDRFLTEVETQSIAELKMQAPQIAPVVENLLHLFNLRYQQHVEEKNFIFRSSSSIAGLCIFRLSENSNIKSYLGKQRQAHLMNTMSSVIKRNYKLVELGPLKKKEDKVCNVESEEWLLSQLAVASWMELGCNISDGDRAEALVEMTELVGTFVRHTAKLIQEDFVVETVDSSVMLRFQISLSWTFSFIMKTICRNSFKQNEFSHNGNCGKLVKTLLGMINLIPFSEICVFLIDNTLMSELGRRAVFGESLDASNVRRFQELLKRPEIQKNAELFKSNRWLTEFFRVPQEEDEQTIKLVCFLLKVTRQLVECGALSASYMWRRYLDIIFLGSEIYLDERLEPLLSESIRSSCEIAMERDEVLGSETIEARSETYETRSVQRLSDSSIYETLAEDIIGLGSIQNNPVRMILASFMYLMLDGRNESRIKHELWMAFIIEGNAASLFDFEDVIIGDQERYTKTVERDALILEEYIVAVEKGRISEIKGRILYEIVLKKIGQMMKSHSNPAFLHRVEKLRPIVGNSVWLNLAST